jgi:hypothetical protein
MITVTNPATDIKFTVGNKKSHVEWTVQCSTNKADVRTFADEMESHGYIKCIVKG